MLDSMYYSNVNGHDHGYDQASAHDYVHCALPNSRYCPVLSKVIRTPYVQPLYGNDYDRLEDQCT